MRVRIPGCDDLAGLNISILTSRYHSTIRQLIALTLAAISIINDQLTRSRDDDQLSFDVFNGLHIAQMDRAGVLDLDTV